MLLTFDVSYAELTDSLRKAGLCFPVVIFLWVLIYLLNAGAWYIIIHDGLEVIKYLIGVYINIR